MQQQSGQIHGGQRQGQWRQEDKWRGVEETKPSANSLRHELQRGKRFYWVLRAASLTPSSSARLILELCSGSSDRHLRSFKQGASKVRGPDKADQRFDTSH